MEELIRGPARRIKNVVVPRGYRIRRLSVGIGRGLRIELDLTHWTGMYLGLYELELNKYVREFARSGYHSFDVGGQNGYDALVLAKLTGGRVISFDCDPVCCDRMRRSFAANPGLADRMEARHAFVAATTDGDRLALDDAVVAPGAFVPDIIKMDIEGGELPALEGAKRIFTERRPSLIVETHSDGLHRECSRFLESFGYHPTTVTPRRWLKDNRPLVQNRWLVARGGPRR